MKVKQILAERQETHGDFRVQSRISQQLKATIRDTQWWPTIYPAHREALDMIMHKTARILSGNAAFADHWDDIAGYATLVSLEITNHGAADPFAELKAPSNEPIHKPSSDSQASKTRSRAPATRLRSKRSRRPGSRMGSQ